MSPSPIIERNNALGNEWLCWLRDTAGRQRGTVYNYASVLVRYLDECVGARALDGVSESDIESWLLRPRGGRAHGRVGTPATRSRDIAVLRSFYKWLHARDLVRSNVAARLVPPPVRNRQPRAIPDSVWAEAWAPAKGQVMAILGLGFFLGLRRAEIAALTPQHVDAQRGLLVGFVRKGGGDDTMPALDLLETFADRAAPLMAPRTPELLWDYLVAESRRPCAHRAGLLGLRNPDHVNKAVKAHLRHVGMPGAFTPHALRHSFVTNMLRMGMPIELVSELANHSALNITMRYVKGGRSRLTEWNQSSAQLSIRDWR